MEKRVWIGGGAFALCALLFIAIWLQIPDAGPMTVDEKAAETVRSWAGTEGEAFWRSVTKLGSSSVIVAVSLLYAGWFGWRRRTAWALLIPVSGAVAYGVNQLLKMWIERPRPIEAWGIEVDGTSFPSGNAMLAMAVYGTIALSFMMYGSAGRFVNILTALIGLAVVAAVGFSRLFFNVHYFTDIVAGYAAGGLVTLAALHMLHKVLGRQDIR